MVAALLWQTLPAGSAAAATTTVTGSGSSTCGSCVGNNGAGTGNGGGNGTSAKPFAIAGQITDLAPGVARALRLSVTNPNNQPLTVSSLSAVPTSVTKRSGATGNCTVSDIVLGAWPKQPFQVPAGGSASSPTTIAVQLRKTATDACQGATFTLTYSGTGASA